MSHDQPSRDSSASRSGQALHSLKSSRLLQLAVLLSVVGAGVWVYAAVTRPAHVNTGSGVATPGMGLVQTTDVSTSEQPSPRLIDRAASALVRLGPSFIVGFLVGWGLRRFLKWTLLLAAVGGVGLYLLNKAGVFDVHYDDLHEKMNEGVDWARQHAGQAKDWAMRYLPSSAAGITGMFFGFRR